MIRYEREILGSRVAYWEKAGTGGRPLVIVHGIRGNHRSLKGMAAHLGGRRVVLVDLPGHGESTPMDDGHGLEHYARFLDELCGGLGLGEFDLWAHSFGANIAMPFAGQTKLPLHKLVLVSPAMQNTGFVQQLLRQFYRGGLALPAPADQFWLANPAYAAIVGGMLIRTRDRTLRRQLHANEQQNLAELQVDVVARAFLSYLDSLPWEVVPRITVPTLVIGGRLDALVSVRSLEKLSRALPDGRLAILDNTGHLAPLEEPERVAELTRAFLD